MFGGNNNMFGGGGYDAMDTGGGFMKSPDKGGKSDAKKSRDKMNLVSLTIKQILKCESLDDSIRVDGVQLHTIKIIGTIESLEPHSTNSVYRVNDNTGTM